jgi:hypothetical protein
VCVHDGAWKHLSTTYLSTGSFDVVRLEYVRGIPYLVLSSENGPRQIYGIVCDGVALVRLENARGVALRNGYHDLGAELGPPMPTRTPSQWEQALASPDRVEVLRSLLWLGGRHDGPNARFVAAFVRRPRARALLEKLRDAKDPWVRDAAALVSS